MFLFLYFSETVKVANCVDSSEREREKKKKST